MPKDGPVDKLTRCVRACKGDQDCIAECERTFLSDGGTIEDPGEGGKVFTDREGGKVFVTDGGKVF